MKNNVKGALLTMGGGLCWGCSGYMGQYMFSTLGMDSKWLVPIRLGFAGVILFLYCLLRYGSLLFKPWTSLKDASLLLAYGILGVSFSQFTYFLCIQLSTAGVATILQDLSPIIILLVSCVTAKRFPKFLEILSILLAIFGVFLISTHGNFSSMVVPIPALISGIICAILVSIYNLFSTPLSKKYPVTILQAWAFLLGGIIMEFLFQGWKIPYVPDFRGFIGIAFVIIVGNVIAFTIYISGIKYIGPGKAILYGFSEPVSAAIISTLLLGSSFSLFDALGFVCIFLMLVLISVRGKKND